MISRVRQRTGFPDQWPWAVKIYSDESTGKNKDECTITYDDPMAAQSAPGFYDGYDFKGKKISVSLATKKKREEDDFSRDNNNNNNNNYDGGRGHNSYGARGSYGGGGGRGRGGRGGDGCRICGRSGHFGANARIIEAAAVEVEAMEITTEVVVEDIIVATGRIKSEIHC